MNSLSWMIYAAEALGNLRAVAFTFAVVTGVIIGMTAFFCGIGALIAGSDPAKSALTMVVRKWWVPVLFAAAATITPSSQTIYLIAASEAGETIVKSQEAKEVFDDLKAIIKNKLKEQLPKAEG